MEQTNSVLVVDDMELMIRTVVAILQSFGFRCQGATGGEQALRVLAEDSFDLVLTDIEMPGIGGVELCRRIRSDRGLQHLRVVVYTGAPDIELVAREAGADAWIEKPFKADQLIEVCRRALA